VLKSDSFRETERQYLTHSLHLLHEQ